MGETLKSRYVVFKRPFVVSIEEEEVREPSSHEVLVKTSCTLISTGTELTAYSKSFPDKSAWSDYVKYPFRPGYCNVGTVIKVGSKVKSVRVGDRVASSAHHTEYAVVSEDNVIKVPDEVPDEEAAFHTIAAGVTNSVRLAQVSLGDSVGVVGVGLLGQMTIIFSKLCGSFPLIAIDLSDARLKLASVSGAHYVINPKREDASDRVQHLTKGRMLDIVFEVTGSPEVIPWAIRLLRRMGKFIVLSSPRGITALDFHDEVNSPSRVIIGTHFSSQPTHETLQFPWTRKRNTELFFELLKNEVIDIRHLITHKFKWSEAPRVYEELWRDRTKFLGVILKWT